MPKHVKLKGFARRCLLQNITCIVPFAVFFCAIWQGCKHEKTWMIAVGIVGGVCCIAIGFALSILQLRNVECPICGYVMREPLSHELTWRNNWRAPVMFYCPKCEIKWDTGMIEGGD